MAPQKSLYAHSDPLLSRLRLLDSNGKLLTDPAGHGSELRDAQVIGFLFGSEVGTTKFGREFYKDVQEFSRRNPHRFKCIYVSIDPNEKSFQESIQGKPWLSCVWNDGSSTGEAQLEEPTAYDEEYIHSVAEDKASLSESAEKTQYEKPYSRVALGEKFDMFVSKFTFPLEEALLKFCIQHLCAYIDKREETMKQWLSGQPNKSELNQVGEIAYRMRWTLALAFLAVAYNLIRYLGGEKYDLMKFVERLFFPHQIQDSDFFDAENEKAASAIL